MVKLNSASAKSMERSEDDRILEITVFVPPPLGWTPRQTFFRSWFASSCILIYVRYRLCKYGFTHSMCCIPVDTCFVISLDAVVKNLPLHLWNMLSIPVFKIPLVKPFVFNLMFCSGSLQGSKYDIIWIWPMTVLVTNKIPTCNLWSEFVRRLFGFGFRPSSSPHSPWIKPVHTSCGCECDTNGDVTNSQQLKCAEFLGHFRSKNGVVTSTFVSHSLEVWTGLNV